MTLRVLVSLVGFGFLVAYEMIDVVLPRRDLTEFRTAYLDREKRKWRHDSGNKIPTCAHGIPDVGANIADDFLIRRAIPIGAALIEVKIWG